MRPKPHFLIRTFCDRIEPDPLLSRGIVEVVQRAIAEYFAKHGVTEDVRDYLMVLEDEKPDDFFQLVSDFIEK